MIFHYKNLGGGAFKEVSQPRHTAIVWNTEAIKQIGSALRKGDLKKAGQVEIAKTFTICST